MVTRVMNKCNQTHDESKCNEQPARVKKKAKAKGRDGVTSERAIGGGGRISIFLRSCSIRANHHLYQTSP